MEVYGAIGRVNLRHNLGIHVLIALGLLAVSPLFMGIANLDTAQSAQVLEMYVALIGIILLVPLFWPDQDSNIRDLIYSKAVPAAAHQLVRLLEAFAILAALTGIFVLVMIKGGCSFPAGEYYLGTLAEAVFLGGLGVLAYGFTDVLAIGYMVPMVYYMANFAGNRYLGKFYLFSMMQGSMEEKIYLGAAGGLCIAAACMWRQRK